MGKGLEDCGSASIGVQGSAESQGRDNNFSSSSWSCCSAGGSCVQNYNGVSCIKTESSSANCPLCPQYQTHLVHDGADAGTISGYLMWMLYISW